MTAARKRPTMPLTLEARDRMRDQQRQETSRLDAILRAQHQLDSEREKADRMIAKAEAGVAARQAEVDRAVVSLIDTSGLTRAALMLDRPEGELARLTRAQRRVSAGRGAPETGMPRVPA